MTKSIGPILIGVLALGLLAASLTFRFMPQIAEQWMRTEFNRNFVTKEIEWVFPFGVRIKDIAILDGEDERSEIIFQAKEILAYWDWEDLMNPNKRNPSRLHVVSPQMIIRKREEKLTHFLSSAPMNEAQESNVPSIDYAVKKWFPDKLLVSNGTIKYEDYGVGYSTIFSKVWLRYQSLQPSDKNSGAFALEYESYWDQIRDEIPAEIFFSFVNYADEGSDLDFKARFDRVDIRSLRPYLKNHITSIPVDGIVSGVMNGDGQWEQLGIHSELTFNRLSFSDSDEIENEVFGLDPFILREVLRNKEGLVQVAPFFTLNLMNGIESNALVFFKELSRSMRSNFMMNLDKVVKDAMNDLRPDHDMMMGNWEHMIAQKEKGFIAKALDRLEQHFKPEDAIRE